MKTTQTIEYSEASKIIDRIVQKALAMRKAAVIAVADSPLRFKRPQRAGSSDDPDSPH